VRRRVAAKYLITATERRDYSCGAALASQTNVFDLTAINLIGGFIFGSIGFVAFVYGKHMHLWKMMLAGLALMIFPYFVENVSIVYGIGGAGTIALFFLCD
jgi:hypothetical protein